MQTLADYQNEVLRTLANPEQREIADSIDLSADNVMLLTVFALGVTGEAGEVADAVKKVIGHGHPLNRAAIIKELGDVLWYVAAISHVLGSSLDEVAAGNVTKLRARFPEGFSSAASRARADVQNERIEEKSAEALAAFERYLDKKRKGLVMGPLCDNCDGPTTGVRSLCDDCLKRRSS